MSTSAAERPAGQRFSHVYLQGGQLLQDSKRARKRIAALIDSLADEDGLSSYLVREMGVDVTYQAYGVAWSATVLSFEQRDVLDLITVTFRFLTEKRRSGMHDPDANDRWLKECGRILREENLSYEIDGAGGVHFKVDAEFAASTRASIVALALPRYANARAEFEKAMNALAGSTVDGKEGIRGVFNAAECVYKLMNPKAPKLTSGDAIKTLQVDAQKVYRANPTAVRAAGKAINAFADWVDACHYYRHEQGVEEPSQVPIDLAVSLISMGSSQLRWLISLDQASKGPPA